MQYTNPRLTSVAPIPRTYPLTLRTYDGEDILGLHAHDPEYINRHRLQIRKESALQETREPEERTAAASKLIEGSGLK